MQDIVDEGSDVYRYRGKVSADDAYLVIPIDAARCIVRRPENRLFLYNGRARSQRDDWRNLIVPGVLATIFEAPLPMTSWAKTELFFGGTSIGAYTHFDPRVCFRIANGQLDDFKSTDPNYIRYFDHARRMMEVDYEKSFWYNLFFAPTREDRKDTSPTVPNSGGSQTLARSILHGLRHRRRTEVYSQGCRRGPLAAMSQNAKRLPTTRGERSRRANRKSYARPPMNGSERAKCRRSTNR